MALGKDVGWSSDREAIKAEFLKIHGFGEARREPLSGDASTRRYERLRTWLTAVLGELLPPERAGDAVPITIQLVALLDGLQTQWLLAPKEIDMFAQVLSYLRFVGVPVQGGTPEEAL